MLRNDSCCFQLVRMGGRCDIWCGPRFGVYFPSSLVRTHFRHALCVPFWCCTFWVHEPTTRVSTGESRVLTHVTMVRLSCNHTNSRANHSSICDFVICVTMPSCRVSGPPDDGEDRCAQQCRQALFARSEHDSQNSLEGLME